MEEFCLHANTEDRVCRGVREVLAEAQTPWQHCRIFRSASLGRCVVIDGDLQSTDMDLDNYHEALVHPAMWIAGAPESVLVCGGGEGATAREVLRHPSVRRVVMVDIDREFVSLCREHLPEWSAGAFGDPRLEVRFEDVFAYVARAEERFDVVICDLTDLLEEVAPGKGFHTQEFYAALKGLLRDGGTLATQASALALFDHGTHTAIRENVRSVFGDALSSRIHADSFFVPWSFVLARKGPLPPVADLPQLFSEALAGSGVELAHHNAASLAASFVHNRRIRGILEG